MCSHIIFPVVHSLLCQNTCTQDAHLAITEYTSLMVTVKTSHGYKFRVGFMNQEDRCFFSLNLDKLSQVLQTESWRTNIDGNSRNLPHLHCDLPPRRCSNCSSMLVFVSGSCLLPRLLLNPPILSH